MKLSQETRELTQTGAAQRRLQAEKGYSKPQHIPGGGHASAVKKERDVQSGQVSQR